jgi:hypothetical protein
MKEYGTLKYQYDTFDILLSQIEFLAINSVAIKKAKKFEISTKTSQVS